MNSSKLWALLLRLESTQHTIETKLGELCATKMTKTQVQVTGTLNRELRAMNDDIKYLRELLNEGTAQ